jgi:hypothetical protein
VCMAFSKTECTSGMVKALVEKETDLTIANNFKPPVDAPDSCTPKDDAVAETKLGPAKIQIQIKVLKALIKAGGKNAKQAEQQLQQLQQMQQMQEQMQEQMQQMGKQMQQSGENQ